MPNNQPFQSVEYSQAQAILLNRSKGAIFIISSCILIPLVGFFLLIGLPSWNEVFTAKATSPAALAMAIFATLPILIVVIAQIFYWRHFKNFYREYFKAISLMDWHIDPNQTALLRAVPFIATDYTYATIAGVTQTNHQPHPVQIFQFQEQGKYHQMILAGLYNSRYSRQNLTIYEIETTQNYPSFALVNKKAFTSLYGLAQNKLVGQDNDISLLIYQDHLDQELPAQEFLQKTGLIESFKALPGLNSVIFHQNMIRLHHDGLQTAPDQLKLFATFLVNNALK